MRWVVAVALFGLMSGCTTAQTPTTAIPTSTNEFAPGQQTYGAEGGITQQQVTYLKGLAWPQSYKDMVNTFGFPSYRTEGEDYYRLEGTESWVVIEYSGAEATGYRTK